MMRYNVGMSMGMGPWVIEMKRGTHSKTNCIYTGPLCSCPKEAHAKFNLGQIFTQPVPQYSVKEVHYNHIDTLSLP